MKKSIIAVFLLAFPLLSYGEQAPVLDAETARCIGCHAATSISDNTPPRVCHKDGCGHPIAIDYASYAKNNPTLRVPDELDPAIKFAGGKLVCTSCHVPYNEYDHRALSERRAAQPVPDPMLVMGNHGSALCLACHIK